MPLYRCIIPEGSVPLALRPQIAKAFTDIHCGNTGAPRNFVHVLFFETPAGSDTPYPTPYFIDGSNRAGRPEELKLKMKAELMEAFCEIAHIPAEQMAARIDEGPASWSMEGGAVLPEPGQEGAEWFGRHATH